MLGRRSVVDVFEDRIPPGFDGLGRVLVKGSFPIDEASTDNMRSAGHSP